MAGELGGASGDFWLSKAPMQVARGSLGVATLNSKIYAIGGMPGSSRLAVGTNEEYDPDTDEWTFKASMPTPRSSFGIAVYQDRIYCIGGLANADPDMYSPVVSGVNEVYDPVRDSWETKASMPTPMRSVQANVIGDNIYVVCGGSNLTWAYDPVADSWTSKAPIPVTAYAGQDYYAAVVDGELYVIGEYFHEVYAPSSDRWSSRAQSFVYAGSGGATTGVKAPKRIYIFGADRWWWDLSLPGFAGKSYDPKTDSWTSCTAMPTGRVGFGVAIVNDKLYAIGGYTPKIGNNVAVSAANEQYWPFGYGTPDLSSPSPLPTASPTLSPSQSPESQPSEPFPTVLVATASGVSVAIIGVGLLVYFKKRKH